MKNMRVPLVLKVQSQREHDAEQIERRMQVLTVVIIGLTASYVGAHMLAWYWRTH